MSDYKEPETIHTPIGAMLTQVGDIFEMTMPIPLKIGGKSYNLYACGIGTERIEARLIEVIDKFETSIEMTEDGVKINSGGKFEIKVGHKADSSDPT